MEGTICQLDPFFTYEVFEGKILSVVRTIAYSDNRKNCSFYCGNDELIFMDDLVDIRYRGGIEFIRADIVGDYLHVLATLYLDNIYYRDGRFIRKNENFQIELIRNRSVKTNPLITAYSINCPHCGASFDSVLSKTCPFCGSGFELAGHHWTIVRLYCVS
jgi:ribosomal protein S27AE